MVSSTPRRYIRRPDSPVVAIRLDLDIEELVYRKWGYVQRAQRGDWLVENDGDVYTVAGDVFERTYRPTGGGPGTYVKATPVWATKAETAGSVATKEGRTHYEAGDYIVSNSSDGSDQYAIAAGKFETLYVPDDEEGR